MICSLHVPRDAKAHVRLNSKSVRANIRKGPTKPPPRNDHRRPALHSGNYAWSSDHWSHFPVPPFQRQCDY
ncbi:Conserved hypothetical protein [Yarrowia lipolytica]|nr:Conserved hypothetical protein [Yarrowia lipolytica]